LSSSRETEKSGLLIYTDDPYGSPEIIGKVKFMFYVYNCFYYKAAKFEIDVMGSSEDIRD